MANKFQFSILTGANKAACQAKYDNIATKSPYTFYLFDKGGVGYLGTTKLFDASDNSSNFNIISSNTTASGLSANKFYFVTADCTITDGQATPVTHTAKAGSIWYTDSNSVPSELSLSIFNTYMANYIASSAVASSAVSSSYTGTDSSLMTAKAVVDFVNAKVTNTSLAGISFFSGVSLPITITSADVTAGEVSYTFDGDSTALTATLGNDDLEGDIGLLFKFQSGEDYDESENDGDICVFINLKKLIDVYVADNTALTTTTTITPDSNNHSKKIKVEVNQSTKTPSDFEQIVLNAIDTVMTYEEDTTNNTAYDPTDTNGDNLSSNKFISESQLADILAHVLKNFALVAYAEGESMGEE